MVHRLAGRWNWQMSPYYVPYVLPFQGYRRQEVMSVCHENHIKKFFISYAILWLPAFLLLSWTGWVVSWHSRFESCDSFLNVARKARTSSKPRSSHEGKGLICDASSSAWRISKNTNRLRSFKFFVGLLTGKLKSWKHESPLGRLRSPCATYNSIPRSQAKHSFYQLAICINKECYGLGEIVLQLETKFLKGSYVCGLLVTRVILGDLNSVPDPPHLQRMH